MRVLEFIQTPNGIKNYYVQVQYEPDGVWLATLRLNTTLAFITPRAMARRDSYADAVSALMGMKA